MVAAIPDHMGMGRGFIRMHNQTAQGGSIFVGYAFGHFLVSLILLLGVKASKIG